ncbi:MAG: hypothetical protein GY696_38095 [Gammaproteobacteria bacterium]|nr:hypothetical protein [Gammaproteobacteria bacterium]
MVLFLLLLLQVSWLLSGSSCGLWSSSLLHGSTVQQGIALASDLDMWLVSFII